jgi:hypothetical protein
MVDLIIVSWKIAIEMEILIRLVVVWIIHFIMEIVIDSMQFDLSSIETIDFVRVIGFNLMIELILIKSVIIMVVIIQQVEILIK